MSPMKMLFAGIIFVILALFVLMFVLPLVGIIVLAPFAIGTLLTGEPVLWIFLAVGAGIVVLIGWVPFLQGILRYAFGFALIAIGVLLWVM